MRKGTIIAIGKAQNSIQILLTPTSIIYSEQKANMQKKEKHTLSP
jgi:hypothetical protein